jgi:Putative lumazine-binding
MKKSVSIILGAILLSVLVISWKTNSISEDEVAIKKLIENSYFKGAYNELDTKSMREGFHKDFAIFYVEGGDTLGKYPINDWISGIEKRKTKPDFDAKKREWKGLIKFVDVTGGSAVAKVELFKNNKLTYTDYLSLLKFEKNWKIVGKVYHEFN